MAGAAALLAAAALYVYVLDKGFGSPAAPGNPSSEVALAPSPGTAGPAPAASPAPSPVPLSAASLLHGSAPDWLAGSLQGNAEVFAIAYPQLLEQAQAMNRMAAYLEKASAPRGRVLDDAELAALVTRSGDVPQTFYLGHDYRMAEVARFFNQARQQQLVLQPQEQRLLALLLAQGWLRQTAAGQASPYQATQPGGALITVARFSAADRALLKLAPDDQVLSEAIVAHEISHSEFLTRPSYRQQCWYFWQTVLGEKERGKWRLLLRRMDYDGANEDLLVNEMQALLMHTPDPRIFSTVHLLISGAELSRQRALFSQAARTRLP